MLGGESLKHELNRCAAWLAQDDGKWKNVSAPKAVVEDMMTARRRDVTVPTLKRVSIVPTFTKDGRLLSEPGFDEASGIFLDLKVNVDVPPQPTPRQVRTALRQLWFALSAIGHTIDDLPQAGNPPRQWQVRGLWDRRV